MNQIKILVIITIVNIACNKPVFFEGKAIYSVRVAMKNPELDSNIIKKMYGKKLTTYYKEGKIRQEMDNGVISIYSNIDNKTYYQFMPDSIHWINAEILLEKVLNTSTNTSEESVLGIPCKVFYIETQPTDSFKNKVGKFNHRKRYYYYSDRFSINDGLFQRCNFNNFNKVYSEVKAVPLKIVEDYSGLVITYEITSIDKEKLSDGIFKIDNGIPQRKLR